MKKVVYPCRNCKYFKECGNTNRTMPCNGRETIGRRKSDCKEKVKSR